MGRDGAESIQWNWKCISPLPARLSTNLRIHSMELKVLTCDATWGGAMWYICSNPFNGIERTSLYSTTATCLRGRNPFNGIESYLRLLKLNELAILFESIQWNWKYTLNDKTMKIIENMNPFNGIERLG